MINQDHFVHLLFICTFYLTCLLFLVIFSFSVTRKYNFILISIGTDRVIIHDMLYLRLLRIIVVKMVKRGTRFVVIHSSTASGVLDIIIISYNI